MSEVIVESLLITLIAMVGFAVAVDISLVRRRAAAETTALHLALAVMTKHLEALGSVTDAWAILESAPGYLVVRNKKGVITYATIAAARLMNSTPAKLIGSTSATLKDTQEGTRTLDDFNHLVSLSGKPYFGEITYRPPGTGEVRRIEFNIAPLREGGKITGTVTVLTDITNVYTSRW